MRKRDGSVIPPSTGDPNGSDIPDPGF